MKNEAPEERDEWYVPTWTSPAYPCERREWRSTPARIYQWDGERWRELVPEPSADLFHAENQDTELEQLLVMVAAYIIIMALVGFVLGYIFS